MIKGVPVELKLDESDEPLLAQPELFAKEIVNKWIIEKAKVQSVNISESLRKDVIKAVEDAEAQQFHVDFAPIQQEVRTMMTSGERFARFVRKQMTQNITDVESRFRFVLGFLLTIIFVTVGLILRYFAPDLPRYGLALVLFFLFTFSFSLLITGQTKT
jgi:hypothetical protein